jgi:hypothetical protein
VTDLDIEALSKLEAEATPGPWCTAPGRVYRRDDMSAAPICDVFGAPLDAQFICASRNALRALLEKAKRLETMETDLRAWMLEKRVSGAESWCQSDRVNEALPELGELLGEHLGYPEYDEKTGELGWSPKGQGK